MRRKRSLLGERSVFDPPCILRRLDIERTQLFFTQDAFHRREEALRKKDLELQESLIKFNKFLQENESKRNRAIKRASDEIKQRLTKEQEVAKLKEHLEQLLVENDKLNSEVKKNMKYARYLELVQETVPEDYPEVADLVNRYRTLKETNRDLSQNQLHHEEENERKRVEFANFQKERANEILNHNNRIASMQRELEADENLTIRLQHEADAGLRMTTQKTLALGQIVMAIGNLLQRCTSGMHGKILKHMEGSNAAAQVAAAAAAVVAAENPNGAAAPASSNNSSNNNGSNSARAGSGSVGNGNLSDVDIIQRGLKAMADLDVVAAYMMDFTAIVQARLDAQRAQKKAAAMAAAAASTGAAPAMSAPASVAANQVDTASIK
ncbi:hypothetical protein PINS_up005153 [Pythium insidiosum]|nr:hypothetical protein PINS_up005153 [Pythium insidiosum]